MNALGPLATIWPWSLESLGGVLQGTGFAGASAVWPAASRALYLPCVVEGPTSVANFFTSNGATASNSLDIGLYTEDGRRLVSTGLTAQAGTSTLQILAVTATAFGPGRYFYALSMNGTAGTFFRMATDLRILRAYGCYQQDLSGASPAGTLPAQATFAAVASSYLPCCGFTARVATGGGVVV